MPWSLTGHFVFVYTSTFFIDEEKWLGLINFDFPETLSCWHRGSNKNKINPVKFCLNPSIFHRNKVCTQVHDTGVSWGGGVSWEVGVSWEGGVCREMDLSWYIKRS